MPPPVDAPVFDSSLHLDQLPRNGSGVSDKLAVLLSVERESYTWNATSAALSQGNILQLEAEVAWRIEHLDAPNAGWIVREVSYWGGNNRKAIDTLGSSSAEQNGKFGRLIKQLMTPASAQDALRMLAKQPGLSLVMASKVYRFCCPDVGAAVDRHSSYFFNSLPVQAESGPVGTCTRFKREWADGQHRASRLATFTDSNCEVNLNEYCGKYLPALATIAEELNSQSGGYLCAATRAQKKWRPADIEMAAYSWWSRQSQYR